MLRWWWRLLYYYVVSLLVSTDDWGSSEKFLKTKISVHCKDEIYWFYTSVFIWNLFVHTCNTSIIVVSASQLSHVQVYRWCGQSACCLVTRVFWSVRHQCRRDSAATAAEFVSRIHCWFPPPSCTNFRCSSLSVVGRLLICRHHSFITYAQIPGFQTHPPTLYAQIVTPLLQQYIGGHSFSTYGPKGGGGVKRFAYANVLFP